MKFMNTAIERDIEDQKNDQSKTMNLYKMNLQAYGDAAQAKLMTQNQLMSIAEMKAKEGMATATNADAQARLVPLVQTIQQQKEMNNWMMSRGQGVSGGTEQSHVNDMKTMLRLNPELYKNMQERYIPGRGTTEKPVTENDKQALVAFDELNHNIKDALEFAKTQGSTVPGTVANAKADAIRQALVTGFQKLHNLNRLSDVDLKLNMENLSSPGAFRTQAAVAQFQQLQKENDDKKGSIYSALGFHPFKETPRPEVIQTWAQQQLAKNPNDPKALELMKLYFPQQPMQTQQVPHQPAMNSTAGVRG
jgi:hypothetical protein